MFYDKYLKATKEKNSVININLDPALPKQRPQNVVPEKYVNKVSGWNIIAKKTLGIYEIFQRK